MWNLTYLYHDYEAVGGGAWCRTYRVSLNDKTRIWMSNIATGGGFVAGGSVESWIGTTVGVFVCCNM